MGRRELLFARLQPDGGGLAEGGLIPVPAHLKASDHNDDYLIFLLRRYPEAPAQSRMLSCSALHKPNALKAATPALRCCRSCTSGFPGAL